MYIELLKQGKQIEISKKPYTTTIFSAIGEKIYYDNIALGGFFVHEKFTKHPEEFDKHIEQMLSENFTIKIF